jgi:hypothetical protein
MRHMSNQPASALIDYNALMQGNLSRVFSERDAARRIVAIRELYGEDAVLYEPDTFAKGHLAINEAVTALLALLPASFLFTADGPATGHHGVGRLRWSSGPPNSPAVVTGMDVAIFEGKSIKSLYVFLDPTAA